MNGAAENPVGMSEKMANLPSRFPKFSMTIGRCTEVRGCMPSYKLKESSAASNAWLD